MNELKRKLTARERVFGTTLMAVEWTGVVEILKNDLLDFLLFDLEHSVLSIESVENIARLCRHMGLQTIARVPDSTYEAVSRTLDMGVGGILVPRVDTVEQARRVASCARFHPEGVKGCGGFPLLKDVGTPEAFNRERVLLMQMESPRGIENLDEILRTVDVDGIIVGPTDLSINSGIPLQFDHPDMAAMIRRVIAVCGEHDVSCGMFLGQEEIARWWGEGMNILWAGADIAFIAQGYVSLCQTVKGLPPR